MIRILAKRFSDWNRTCKVPFARLLLYVTFVFELFLNKSIFAGNIYETFILQFILKMQVHQEFREVINPLWLIYIYSFSLAILAIFLKYNLNLSEDTSTFVYHAFTGLMFTSAIVAAIIADQYLGKFKTIIWMSLMNVFGLLLMTLVVIPLIKLPLT